MSFAAAALSWFMLVDGSADTAPAGEQVSVQAVADESPGYAVEAYQYPQAEKVLEEQGVILKRGDGHITLADCAAGGDLLEIYSMEAPLKVCFKVTGASGWLTMEIPSVFGVKTSAHETELGMTLGEEHKTYDLPANSWRGVGQAADEYGRSHMLVEIRTSK